MKIDLDRIEATAKAALECAPTPWVVDKMMTVDLKTMREVVAFEDDYEGYSIIAGEVEIISDPALDHDIAHYIAECSPDVVLALVARIRELEDAQELAADAAMERDWND